MAFFAILAISCYKNEPQTDSVNNSKQLENTIALESVPKNAKTINLPISKTSKKTRNF
jgi:hypothetical protein